MPPGFEYPTWDLPYFGEFLPNFVISSVPETPFPKPTGKGGEFRHYIKDYEAAQNAADRQNSPTPPCNPPNYGEFPRIG